MATRMTGLCRKGADLLWKQCNTELFPQGVMWLQDAGYTGDADAWYFLGECCSRGEGQVKINEKKARDCYRKGAALGSFRAVVGAVLAGLYDGEIRKTAVYSFEESMKELRRTAEKGDAYAAYQMAMAYEAGIILTKSREESMGIDMDMPTEPMELLTALRAAESEKAAEAEQSAEAAKSAEPMQSAEPAQSAELVQSVELEGASEPTEAPEQSRPSQPAALSVSWYKKAADGGIADAMVRLGICYQTGCYVKQDQERYLDWADKAASLGNVWGLHQMGCYYRFCGEAEAAEAYFQAAIRQGDAVASFYLGEMYLCGEGMERDREKAVTCLEFAACHGVSESYIKLGELFYQGTSAVQDAEQALYWYELAWKNGYREAAFPLACLYLKHSEEQDCQKAETLLQEIAETETDGQAALILGNLNRDGLCGSKDLEQAVFWYEKGAKQGNTECMELLGTLFFQGEEEIDADYARSFYWLNRCMEAGTLKDCLKLAFLYRQGKGCEASEEMAIRLYEMAAQTESDGRALYELGCIYEKQSSSPETLEKAAAYYQKAIAMGNKDAGDRFSHFKKGLFGRWKIIS